MALNFEDPETDRLARVLARETGESVTVAVRITLRERLALVRAARSKPAGVDEWSQIIERGRTRNSVDEQPTADTLGYDEHCLPA